MQQTFVLTALPELTALDCLIEAGWPFLERRHLGDVTVGMGACLPLLALTLGNPDPALPAVGIFGGHPWFGAPPEPNQMTLI